MALAVTGNVVVPEPMNAVGRMTPGAAIEGTSNRSPVDDEGRAGGVAMPFAGVVEGVVAPTFVGASPACKGLDVGLVDGAGKMAPGVATVSTSIWSPANDKG